MIKKIVNQQTGEEKEIEMTADEIQQIENEHEKFKAERLAVEQAKAEKQAKLKSAKAKLTALGLDEDEVNALLGISI